MKNKKQRLSAPVDEIGRYSVAYKNDGKERIRYFEKMADAYVLMARVQTGGDWLELLGWKDEEMSDAEWSEKYIGFNARDLAFGQ